MVELEKKKKNLCVIFFYQEMSSGKKQTKTHSIYDDYINFHNFHPNILWQKC